MSTETINLKSYELERWWNAFLAAMSNSSVTYYQREASADEALRLYRARKAAIEYDTTYKAEIEQK